MERREGMPASGVTTTLEEADSSFQFPLRSAAPRIDNPSHGSGVNSSSAPAAEVGAGAQLQPQPQPQQPVPAGPSPSGLTIVPFSVAMPMKKKRGRPRKYAPDGSVLPLNPKPISASMPPGEYSASAVISMKRGRGRASGFLTKQQPRIDLESLGLDGNLNHAESPFCITITRLFLIPCVHLF